MAMKHILLIVFFCGSSLSQNATIVTKIGNITKSSEAEPKPEPTPNASTLKKVDVITSKSSLKVEPDTNIDLANTTSPKPDPGPEPEAATTQKPLLKTEPKLAFNKTDIVLPVQTEIQSTQNETKNASKVLIAKTDTKIVKSDIDTTPPLIRNNKVSTTIKTTPAQEVATKIDEATTKAVEPATAPTTAPTPAENPQTAPPVKVVTTTALPEATASAIPKVVTENLQGKSDTFSTKPNVVIEKVAATTSSNLLSVRETGDESNTVKGGGSGQAKSSKKKTIIIVVVVAVFLVIAVIVILLIIRRKRGNANLKKEKQNEKEANQLL